MKGENEMDLVCRNCGCRVAIKGPDNEDPVAAAIREQTQAIKAQTAMQREGLALMVWAVMLNKEDDA